MNRIIGLDVGRGSAVLCCLDSLPDNLGVHYKKLKNNGAFYKVNCSRSGVEKLLSLKPTAMVLEPSGHWYSHFWVMVAKKYDIELCWVGHSDLAGQRKNYGFTNKRDEEDALCLAACYFNADFVDVHGKKRFLDYYQDEAIVLIRELFHEKEQLQKLRTGMIAILRQRLCFEFPEAAQSSIKISSTKGYSPLVYWLAFNTQTIRYNNKYSQSIAHELGITISRYTRDRARDIINFEKSITQTTEQLEAAIRRAEFDPYNQVFDRFGFGVTCRALLLVHVFPIDRFLVGGNVWVEYERSIGKMQKRDRSLRKFQAYLGMSYRYEISGNTKKKISHGSALVHTHLYMWAVCMVARKGNIIGSEIGKQLSDRYEKYRSYHRGKDSLNRILFKATRMLFYELVNEIKHKKY